MEAGDDGEEGDLWTAAAPPAFWDPMPPAADQAARAAVPAEPDGSALLEDATSGRNDAMVGLAGPAGTEQRQRGFYSLHDVGHAVATLREGRVAPRPLTLALDVNGTPVADHFLEKPVQKRRKGSDRWVTSGGRKGATEAWVTSTDGVLKRYGRIFFVAVDIEPIKFAQYTLITRSEDGGAVLENKAAALWVLDLRRKPEAGPSSHAAVADEDAAGGPRLLSMADQLAVQAPASGNAQAAALEIRAGSKFISFQSDRDGIELGEITRHGDGVKLSSAQGDFAEWHRLADGEPPLAEGDIVGFRRGRISRNTRRCTMLGIVTRKAVVEGSAPEEYLLLPRFIPSSFNHFPRDRWV